MDFGFFLDFFFRSFWIFFLMVFDFICFFGFLSNLLPRLQMNTKKCQKKTKGPKQHNKLFFARRTKQASASCCSCCHMWQVFAVCVTVSVCVVCSICTKLSIKTVRSVLIYYLGCITSLFLLTIINRPGVARAVL